MEFLLSDEKIARIRQFRGDRVKQLIADMDLDFLLLWDYGNTRYAFDIFSAFHYESAHAFHGYLISKEGVVSIILSDSFEEHHPYSPGGLYDPAKNQGEVWTVDPVVRSAGSESYLRSVPKRYARLVAEAMAANGGGTRVGVDTFADFRAYQELQALTPEKEYIGVGFDLAKVRMYNCDEEVELMEKTCEVHNRVLWQGMSEVEPGWTDFQLSSRMAELFALEPTVEKHCLNLTYSYDPGGAMGMIWSPIGRVYKDGETVTSDVGIMTFGGSTTDYGRARILGEPSKELWEDYYWFHTNHHEIMAQVKPGMKCSDMVQMYIDAHEERGMPLVMLGHGVGTQMDEMPQLNPAESQEYDAVLEKNMTLCIEPACVSVDPVHGPQILWCEDQWVVEDDRMRRLAPLSYFDIEDSDLATMQ
ncbi:MAG: M24 family metallopeptidase [Acidimicrobiia bacterium]